MARNLKNINGRFVESDYENALIHFLEQEGWQYIYGDDIPRTNRKEVLYMDDLHQFSLSVGSNPFIVANVVKILVQRVLRTIGNRLINF